MMARNDTLTLPADTWVQLTDGDVTEITIQNQSRIPLLVKATVGATAPNALAGSAVCDPGLGGTNIDIAELFPGISGANRLWGYFHQNAGRVFVSHG